jgi:hypothetical protein
VLLEDLDRLRHLVRRVHQGKPVRVLSRGHHGFTGSQYHSAPYFW